MLLCRVLALNECTGNKHTQEQLQRAGSVYWRGMYSCPWRGGQRLWGKVCVAVYHWPGQGCWKMLHLHTQAIVLLGVGGDLKQLNKE